MAASMPANLFGAAKNNFLKDVFLGAGRAGSGELQRITRSAAPLIAGRYIMASSAAA